MVLPKEIRKRAGISGGDKLAVISLEKEGSFCCLMLTKADDVSNMVRVTLAPVAEEMLNDL